MGWIIHGRHIQADSEGRISIDDAAHLVGRIAEAEDRLRILKKIIGQACVCKEPRDWCLPCRLRFEFEQKMWRREQKESSGTVTSANRRDTGTPPQNREENQ